MSEPRNKVTTIVHVYRFDIGSDRWRNVEKQAGERAAYEELCAKLSGMGLRKMETRGGFGATERNFRGIVRQLSGKEIEVETDYLFDDQINTAPIPGVSEQGLRLHDWKEEVFDNPDIKEGQWLEQTESLVRARRETLKCGYCGKQEPIASGLTFCPHCIDSEYLTLDKLHLTRLLPVAHDDRTREPLTTAEKVEREPLYLNAQIHGATERGRARVERTRKRLEEEYQRDTATARTKRDGLVWLMDRGFNTDNVIYYSHTDTFSVGWRRPLSDDEIAAWLDIMVEFPFRYQLVGINRNVEGAQ